MEALKFGFNDRLFILTGAGISAESGLKTFRDSGGLWENHRVEQVASPEGWHASPEVVWRFYSARRAQASGVQPNAAHVALAKLEERLGDRLFLCTQNVDDLHERAGSQKVCHMHGQLFLSRCEDPNCPDSAPFEDRNEYVRLVDIPACRHCGARIRPHICWFGEVPFELEQIDNALSRCSYFIVIGSSGSVYPAAGFVSYVRARPTVRTIYVGPEKPENAAAFDECLVGKATEIVPGFLST